MSSTPKPKLCDALPDSDQGVLFDDMLSLPPPRVATPVRSSPSAEKVQDPPQRVVSDIQIVSTFSKGQTTAAPNGEAYLSVKEVAKRYGVSVPTIWRRAADAGPFPTPHKLFEGTTRWSLSDLTAFEDYIKATQGAAK
jgi:predicted DNA-binding transcriptional regulator AlpA